MYISKPSDLSSFMEEKCKSLAKLYAEQVLFDFTRDNNVLLRYAFRLVPDAGPLSLETPIRVGNIGQFRSLRVLFEFMVDPVDSSVDEVVLAFGTIRMEIPTWSTPSTKLKMNLRLPIRSNAETDSPPQAILQAMSKTDPIPPPRAGSSGGRIG